MKRFTILTAAFALVMAVAPLRAQRPSVLDYKCSPTYVALTTTSKTAIITSNLTRTPRDEVEVVVIGYAQLTTGTNTTAVTARIRRGTTTSDTLVNEANAEQVKAAAGS